MATSTRRSRTGDNTKQADDMGNASESEPVAHHDVAHRAYELYEQRGGEDGQDVDDWLLAEHELGTR
jgi:hypothetical protein